MGFTDIFGGNLPGNTCLLSICLLPIAATGVLLIKLVFGLLEFDPTFRKLTPIWETTQRCCMFCLLATSTYRNRKSIKELRYLHSFYFTRL